MPTTTTPATGSARPPRPAQLRYLRDLAMQRGETFAMPRTSREAGAEITRLLGRPRSSAADARRERHEVSRDLAADAYATGVQTYELGDGWATKPSRQLASSAPTPARRGETNPPVELGRYTTTGDGERIVRGQRVDGAVRMTDIPADDEHGRRYLIEAGLHSNDELAAILADYLEQAAMHDAIPAHVGVLGDESA
jgi:hypothetical protein